MSNLVTRMARPLQMTAAQKAVLMCLADHADDTGLAWPSIPGICRWTCLSRTAVITAMRWLEQHRIVSIDKATGKQNRCTVMLDKLQQLGDQCATRTGVPDEPVCETHSTSTPDALPPVREADGTSAPGAPKAPVSIKREAPVKPQKRVKTSAVVPDDMLPDEIPVDAWRAYEEMRNSIKKPMTVNAQMLLFNKLRRLHEQGGHDVRAMLEEATIGNWSSVYPPKGGVKSEAQRRADSSAGAARLLGFTQETFKERDSRQNAERIWEMTGGQMGTPPAASTITIDMEAGDVTA